jgi:hypothetical protein
MSVPSLPGARAGKKKERKFKNLKNPAKILKQKLPFLCDMQKQV